MKTIKVNKIINRIAGLGVSFALLDQLSKFLIQNYTKITIHTNTGIAFSLPIPPTLQIVASILLLAAILIFAKSILIDCKNENIGIFALALIFGGGLGNLIDRIILGHVIDFINLQVWPVFNLGDSFITIGAILIGILILRK